MTVPQSFKLAPPVRARAHYSQSGGKWRTRPGTAECDNIPVLSVKPEVTLETARVDTPVGALFLVAREGVLVAASFDGRESGLPRALERRFGPISLEKHPDPGGIVSRLRAYFKGDLAALDAIPADPGGTPFQQRVWTALRRIPVGTTLSYSMMARDIGDPDAVRAVGTANGSNPVPVVIPCHRVIGADGSLTGYGGGLERKRWLLVHEGVQAPGLQTRLPFDPAR